MGKDLTFDELKHLIGATVISCDFDGNAVEESYLNADGIRVDLNYYELTDERARTWLFYRN